jgi:hypothetical protein
MPYVIVYGGLGLFIGLAIGLVLRVTAVIVLTVSRKALDLT